MDVVFSELGRAVVDVLTGAVLEGGSDLRCSVLFSDRLALFHTLWSR